MNFKIIGENGRYKVYVIKGLFNTKHQLKHERINTPVEVYGRNIETICYSEKGTDRALNISEAESLVRDYVKKHTNIERVNITKGG